MIVLLNGLAYGVLLLILSSGLALIFGLRGVVNFAHGAIYMLAAYLALTVSQLTNFWVALVTVPIVLGVAGFLLDKWGLRYLAKRDPLDLMLLTFGLTFVLTSVVQTFWGPAPRSVSPPPVLSGGADILGVQYPSYRFFLICVGLAVALALTVWLRRSRVGLHVRALSTNRVVAGVVGVNVDRVSAVIVGMGAALAGLAGVLAGPYLSLSLNMGTEILILTFIVVVVGGLGSIGGPMLAALVIGLLNSLASTYANDVAAYIPYALMLLVLLFRPKGFAGTRTI